MSAIARRAAAVPGPVLYAFTLVCELPAAWARTYLAFALVWFVSETQAVSPAYRWPLAYLAGYGPLAWSLLALAWPVGSGWWWRERRGGRDPSGRERLAYEAALDGLGRGRPRRWFVVDEPLPGAAVCGDTLMLTRTMLDEPALGAVLAHELAHLESLDGRLTAALNRLVLWTPARRRRALGVLVRGGLGLRILRAPWAAWWRKRELRADDHARALGKGTELAVHLESHALLHDRPIPFMWLSDHLHPPTEERIARLLGEQ